MKKSRVALALAMVLALATFASGQTAESVIQRAIDAMGGQAAFDSITSMSMTMSGTMMETMQIGMTMFTVKPDKIRIEMSMMGMEIIQATDGTDYWMSQAGQVMDMPEMQKEQFASNKDMFTGGGLSNLEALGATLEYIGKDTANGIEADVVKLTFENGMIGNYYFSTADGLPFMMRMDTQVGEMTMNITEYKQFGIIKMPTKMEMETPQGPMVFTIDDVQINPALEDTLFTRPQ